MAEERRFIPVRGTASSSSQGRPIGYASASQETIEALKAESRPKAFLPPVEEGIFPQPILDTARRPRTEGYKPFFIDEFRNNRDSSFRFIGSESMDWSQESIIPREEAIKDFIRTGQVRGELSSPPYRTYFSKGEAYTDYIPAVRDARGETAKNLLYQVNDRFDIKNPLYTIDQGFTGVEHKGYHNILLPKENPSFLDTINPANRKGIKMTAFDTTERFVPAGTYAPESLMYTKPVVTNVIYDRTKPFYQTSLSQNLKNLGVEAKILGNAKLPAGVAPSLGAAGGLLSIGMQAYGATRDNMYDKEYGYSDPFAIRPIYDLALSGIGNNQTPAEGAEAMRRQVSDPEWQKRNPIGAVPYNLLFGNTEPAKAFAEGYRPFFTMPNIQRYDIAGAR